MHRACPLTQGLGPSRFRSWPRLHWVDAVFLSPVSWVLFCQFYRHALGTWELGYSLP